MASQTSILSHHKNFDEGKYSEREKQILRTLGTGIRPMSARGIAEKIGCYPSSLTQAIQDLFVSGVIEIANYSKDPVTLRTVQFYQIKKA